jgi:hypothetical protein
VIFLINGGMVALDDFVLPPAQRYTASTASTASTSSTSTSSSSGSSKGKGRGNAKGNGRGNVASAGVASSGVASAGVASSGVAIIEAFYPGMEGSKALAQSMFGESNRCVLICIQSVLICIQSVCVDMYPIGVY